MIGAIRAISSMRRSVLNQSSEVSAPSSARRMSSTVERARGR